MTTRLSRREFIASLTLYSAAFSGLLLGSDSRSVLARALAESQETQSPQSIWPDRGLINIKGQHLNFGTSLYPFRSKQDPQWLFQQARDLGLTEVRIGYPRDRVELGVNTGQFDPSHFHEPKPEILDMLRQSNFDVLLLLVGHGADRHHQPVDWPRNPDGSINGEASAREMANYSRWAINHTKDFATTYELWNEAFNRLEDPLGNKGFGPGGSKENADNYVAMMAPSLKEVRQLAPHAQVTVEGNYWNLERSVDESPAYQELLQQTDYVVIHPYGYHPGGYEPTGGKGNQPGQIYKEIETYRRINPQIKFWYSEYGVTPHDVGLPDKTMSDYVQAKCVLRATMLHLVHGIEHLDIFCMFYPTIAHFSLIREDKTRRPSWFAYQRLLAAAHPKQPSVSTTIERSGTLSGITRDLAIATPKGFTYCIWQETPVTQFKERAVPRLATVRLKCSDGRQLRLQHAEDPLLGQPVPNVRATNLASGELELAVPTTDYPIFCTLSA